MKLYRFYPNDWGTEYFVMSDSRENAIEAVKKFIVEEINTYISEKDRQEEIQESFEELNHYINEIPWENGSIPKIIEYDINQVIESEIS